GVHGFVMRFSFISKIWLLILTAAFPLQTCWICIAQVNNMQKLTSPQSPDDTQAQDELQKGTALTRQADFSEAIPHLLAARAHVTNDYAASFNLALCYVGTREFKKAIEVLSDLRNSGRDGADVENLLTQAYIGNLEPKEAWAALQRASAITPRNVKLYLFIADACAEYNDFSLGLKVVETGLRNIPRSPRLHYDRAMFLSQLDEIDRAQEDFKVASELGQGSEIGYLALAQRA